MENNNSQLELFSGIKEKKEQKMRFPDLFLSSMRKYEKVLLVIILVIITGLVSFCLGVEKGKNLVQQQTNRRIDVALNKQVILKQEPLKIKQQAVQQPVKVKKETLQEGYIIQVASYVTKDSANQAAVALKKKGFNAFSMQKGRYFVLYVGNFTNRESASAVLTELKKQYKDCLIKRRI